MSEAVARFVPPVEYPESDDTPVESMKQWNVVAQVVMALRRMLGRRALVAANMGVYFRRGDPTGVIVPDMFVAMGEPLIDEPDTYLIWEQGKPPDFALEVASKSTFRKDRREKIATYRSVGVKEYFLHDATDRFLSPRLQGFRYVPEKTTRKRTGKKERTYVPVEPTLLPNGGIRLHSDVLKVDFHAVPGEAAPQLFDERGELLLSHEDAAAEERRRREEEQRLRQEEQRLRQEEQRRRQEEQRRRQEEGRARLAAEQEAAELRRRLAKFENPLA